MAHFLAAKDALFAFREPGEVSTTVTQALAFGLDANASEGFPLLIGEFAARALLEEFTDDSVVTVLQRAEGQRNDDGATEECFAPWNRERFDRDEGWVFLQSAHIEPTGRWESFRLICEHEKGGMVYLISALAGERLMNALKRFIWMIDTLREMSGPKD